MDYLYLATKDDGQSSFETRNLIFAQADFAPPAPPMGVSPAIPAKALLFLTLPPGWRDDAHRSPREQIALCLSGRMRVRSSTGDVRIVEPGGMWHMADTSGAGHASEVVGDEPVRLAIVQLV